MQILQGTTRDFSPEIQNAISQYRHAIFIERLGWDLPVQDGLEQDQFDRDDTLYVVTRDPDTAEISGCARLLPTTKPYLLGEIFPHLMNGQPAPAQSDVWELSRFASMDLRATPSQSSTHNAARQTRNLLAASVSIAVSYGAKRLITVSPLGVERLLMRMGVNSHRAGPPVLVDGKPVFACWIELDAQTLSALGIHLEKNQATLN
jgi:acyl homoserine lactone synthase